MFRKIAIASLGSLLGLSLLTFMLVTTALRTARPEHLKAWAQHSGIYQTSVDNALAQANKEQAKSGSSDGNISLQDPAVQDAARKAFTPQLIQRSVEQLIDGTFHWLDGKVAKPDFSIDLSAAKQTFADAIVAHAKQRYAALPACAPRTLPTSTDPLTINCKPPVAFDINTEGDKLRQQTMNNKDFLSDTTINADTLKSDKDGAQTTVFDQFKGAPKAYRSLKLVPIVVVTVGFVSAAGIVLLNKQKYRGLRKLAWPLGITGALGVLSVILNTKLLEAARAKVLAQNSSMTQPFRNSVFELLSGARNDANRYVVVISSVYIILAAAFIVGYIVLKRKDHTEPEHHQTKEETALPRTANKS